MCIRAVCEKCRKQTWRGCGKHKEQVLKGVKEEDLCKCNPKK